MLTAGAAALLMIAGCSLVRSSPTNASRMWLARRFFPQDDELVQATCGAGRRAGSSSCRGAWPRDRAELLGIMVHGLQDEQEAPALAVAAARPRLGADVLGVQFVGVDVEEQHGQREGLHAALRASLPKPE